MEVKRFFCDRINGEFAGVVGEEFNHAIKVLRYKVGFAVELCDNTGYVYQAIITEVNENFFKAKIIEKALSCVECDNGFTLFQALPKPDKVDFIVQKAVEIGYNNIAFFTSQNTNENKFNCERLNKIAKDATKQCRRAKLTTINDKLLTFNEMIAMLNGFDFKFAAYEKESQNSFYNTNFNETNQQTIALIIGSEGGFTTQEYNELTCANCKTLTLGKRILRVETAFIFASSLLMYKFKELNV